MSVRRRRTREERLRKLINLLKTASRGKLDPLEVDVGRCLDELAEMLPSLQSPQEHSLDAEAIYQATQVLGLQGDAIARQASPTHLTPETTREIVAKLSLKHLGKVLAASMRPVVASNSLTREALEAAVEYWRSLPPIVRRLRRLGRRFEEVLPTELEALEELGLLSREELEKAIEEVGQELRRRWESGEDVEYWSFVKRDDYAESVVRALAVSFVATRGSAFIEQDPAGELRIKPPRKTAPRSVAISLGRLVE